MLYHRPIASPVIPRAQTPIHGVRDVHCRESARFTFPAALHHGATECHCRPDPSATAPPIDRADPCELIAVRLSPRCIHRQWRGEGGTQQPLSNRTHGRPSTRLCRSRPISALFTRVCMDPTHSGGTDFIAFHCVRLRSALTAFPSLSLADLTRRHSHTPSLHSHQPNSHNRQIYAPTTHCQRKIDTRAPLSYR